VIERVRLSASVAEATHRALARLDGSVTPSPRPLPANQVKHMGGLFGPHRVLLLTRPYQFGYITSCLEVSPQVPGCGQRPSQARQATK
jgi:hypothetical protein